jgi:uncharacterized membrane protein YsdA (DUF1294 family)
MTSHHPSALQTTDELLALIGPANLTYALIAINFAAFAAFGIDKAKAETGAWRVQETTLLTLAFFGGSPGAYAGRTLFRHKSRKQPFNHYLQAIVIVQVLALGGWFGWAIVP